MKKVFSTLIAFIILITIFPITTAAETDILKLTTTRLKSGAIRLDWADVGADEYIIYAAEADAKSIPKISTTNKTTYTFKNDKDGVHKFVIIAKFGKDKKSSQTVYCYKGTLGTLTTPTVSVKAIISYGSEISWNEVKGATDYVIYTAKAGEKYKEIATVSESRYNHIITDTGTYYYIVEARTIKYNQITAKSARSIETSIKITEKSTLNKNGAKNLGNMINAVIKDDWIYYVNKNDSKKIYKIKVDGSGNQKVSNEASDYINVVGDWIYYANRNDDSKIYKIKINGTGKEKINNDMSSSITVIDDWIYYNNTSDSFKIYKIKTDGTKRTKLCDDKIVDIVISGDWIYYTNWNEYNIYRVKTDGSNKQNVNSQNSSCINIIGDSIYYINRNNYTYRIYKMKIDGTDNKLLFNDDIIGYNNVLELNIHGDRIYYGDGNWVYKIRTDGTDKQELKEGYSFEINIVGDWIYYQDYNVEQDINELYKMRTDGTEIQKV